MDIVILEKMDTDNIVNICYFGDLVLFLLEMFGAKHR